MAHRQSLMATTATTNATAATTTTAINAERETMQPRMRTEMMRARARSHIRGSGARQSRAMIEDVQSVEDGVYILVFVPRTSM